MKITKSTVQKITITDVKCYDPIEIFIEDFNLGNGKITINADSSYSYHWSAMGDSNMMEFFVSCDNHYLSGKLGFGLKTEPDYEAFRKELKHDLLSMRRIRCLDADKANSLYNLIENLMEDDTDWMYYSTEFNDLCKVLYNGCHIGEVLSSIPTKYSEEYNWFCEELDIIKEAFRKILRGEE